MSLEEMYKNALARDLIGPEVLGSDSRIQPNEPNAKCEFHMDAPGHSTNNCPRLKHRIQDLIDHKHLILNPIPPPNVNTNPLPNHASGSVNMITAEEEPIAAIGSIAQTTTDDLVSVITPWIVNFVPREPNRLGHESYHAVPRDYGTHAGTSSEEVFSMTRSGRCYIQPEAPPKEKEVEVIPKKKVTNEEANAFMKMVKDTEYKVVDQLRKTPAQISLLALLLSSEPHRDALINVLKEAIVPKEISASQVEDMVGSIFSGQITFGDEELSSEEQQHTKALHIVCKSMGYVLSRVMVDNGSALNVCPMSTLQQMKVAPTLIRPTKSVVRAFDGKTREVQGEIDLPLEIGPCTFNVTFKVMDIPGVYSLLLGRPWIHAAGAVPSTLHQKVKFILEDRVVVINGEDDYNIYKETAVPFVGTEDEDPLSFHTFELISVIKDWGEPTPNKTDLMVGRMMLGANFILGQGLGIRGQGIVDPVAPKEHKGTFGLGFRPTLEDCIYARRKRLAGDSWPMRFPPLAKSFPGPPQMTCPDGEDVQDSLSGLFSSDLVIGALLDEVPPGPLVRPMTNEENISNWMTLPIYALSSCNNE